MKKRIALSVLPDTGVPPSEFRIFTSGRVVTVKGTFLFDAKAAQLVMNEYRAHGIDVQIDYDHASLSTAVAPDPAQAGKAAGWFNLELRRGELWAVNVRWTQPAAEALARHEWRFVSPAFLTQGPRIVALMNVAITNLPATRKLDPLIAASRSNGMTLDEMVKVAKALGFDMSATVEDVMAKVRGEDAVDDPVVPIDEPLLPEAMAGPGTTPPAPSPPASDEEEKKKLEAAGRMAIMLTGKADPGEAVAELTRRSRVAVDIETREVQLAKDRAALEGSERRTLVGHLVKLGVELPATAWADDKATAPCKRLTDEPIDELRNRVKVLSAAKQTSPKVVPLRGAPSAPEPSADQVYQTTRGAVTLSASELRACTEVGAEPKDYAENKAYLAKSGA